MTRTLLFVVAFLAVGACGARQRAAADDRPNVLFIAIDDLKPTLGCYGDTVAVTPAIDQLAAQSTVFLNAHCQWPVCGPSRASLMTGLRPEASGVMNLKTSMRAKNPDVVTLAQYFQQNGYATTGVGKIYDPRCVDDRKTLDAPSWSIPFAQVSHRGLPFKSTKLVTVSADVADNEMYDGRIADKGIALLKQLAGDDQPFFLGVGFKKPHLPFVAPQRYWDLYQRDKLKLATHAGGIKDASGYTIHDNSEFRGYEGVPKSGPIPTELQLEAIHGYYACASYIDAQVGRLLAELKSLGIDDQTTIVLWGDHGFHLGDHGLWGKHTTLEHAARVPLLIRPPEGSGLRETNSPVELLDLFPTLCEFSGLPVPANLQGHSLAPIVREEVTSVRTGAITLFKSKGSLGYSYRTDRYRLTQWVNKKGKVVAKELYDYQLDPLETKNLADDPGYTAVVNKLADQFAAESGGCEQFALAND